MTNEQINAITAQALNQSTTMGNVVQQLVGIISQVSNENEELKKKIDGLKNVEVKE